MLNELVLFFHIVLLVGALLCAVRLGTYALIAFGAMCGICANIFVLKQITLFGLTVTPSDAFMIGNILSLNIVQEYYGRKLARTSMLVNFFAVIFYTFASQVHLLYAPAATDQMNVHYAALLAPMPRILFASIGVYVLVQQVDYHLYGMLKKMSSGRFVIVRNVACLSITQLIDTVLFSFFGLYGLVASIIPIICFSYIIKMIIIALSSPAVRLASLFIKPMTFVPARMYSDRTKSQLTQVKETTHETTN